tara:strand:- start:143 stop:265 length:123 start_codon:yes stop_codon:yes gene_type:complete
MPLTRNQKKIDANKDGKISRDDFKILNKNKNKNKKKNGKA